LLPAHAMPAGGDAGGDRRAAAADQARGQRQIAIGKQQELVPRRRRLPAPAGEQLGEVAADAGGPAQQLARVDADPHTVTAPPQSAAAVCETRPPRRRRPAAPAPRSSSRTAAVAAARAQSPSGRAPYPSASAPLRR